MRCISFSQRALDSLVAKAPPAVVVRFPRKLSDGEKKKKVLRTDRRSIFLFLKVPKIVTKRTLRSAFVTQLKVEVSEQDFLTERNKVCMQQ